MLLGIEIVMNTYDGLLWMQNTVKQLPWITVHEFIPGHDLHSTVNLMIQKMNLSKTSYSKYKPCMWYSSKAKLTKLLLLCEVYRLAH